MQMAKGRPVYAGVAFLATAAVCGGQDGKAVFQRVCSACHTPDSVVTPRSRTQWQETLARMIASGAKVTEEESRIVLDYLASQYGSQAPPPAGRGGGAPAIPRSNVGALDKHIVDQVAATRGRKVWAAECITCHGTNARGDENVPNLVRSEMILRDRYGSQLGPYLRKGHPTQSGTPGPNLTPAQIAELSHFIHERVYDTLRGSASFRPQNVVTGDARAGAAWFNGEGRCATCHSPTGDLARIGSKYDPATLQGRFLFPRGGGRGARSGVTLTVTPPDGPAITGTPVVFDDFNIAIRDGGGGYHSWKRTPALRVVKNDPFAAHDELLDKYTDKNMHDMLAYLETLK
jgi:mono/diheme cytochrome c family protein